LRHFLLHRHYRGGIVRVHPAIAAHAVCMGNVDGNGVADESIHGEWSGAIHNEGREARDIQQVNLITHRSELRA
jgi:hypothetical protein